MNVIRSEQLVLDSKIDRAALEPACAHTAMCEIAGTALQLRTNMPEVARLFALRYTDHPTSSHPHIRCYAAEVPNGYAFWSNNASVQRWKQGPLPADAVAFLADRVALTAIINSDPALISFQAVSLESTGMAIAITGHASQDKSRILLACVRRGMRIYSDERTILRENVVQPYLRRNSPRGAGTRLLLVSDLPGDAISTEPRLSIKRYFGTEAIAQPLPLRALVTIDKPGFCAALEEIDTTTALSGLIGTLQSAGGVSERATRAISLLKAVACYKLTLGTPDENAAAIAWIASEFAK